MNLYAVYGSNEYTAPWVPLGQFRARSPVGAIRQALEILAANGESFHSFHAIEV